MSANEERNPKRVRLNAMLAVSEAEGTVADAAGPNAPRPRNRHQSPSHRRQHQLSRRDDLTTEDLVARHS